MSIDVVTDIDTVLRKYSLDVCQEWDASMWEKFEAAVTKICRMVQDNNTRADSNRFYAEYVLRVEQYHKNFPAAAIVKDIHRGVNLQVKNPTVDQLRLRNVSLDGDPLSLQEVVSQPEGTLRLGREMFFVRYISDGNILLQDTEQSQLEPLFRLSPDFQRCCQHLLDVPRAQARAETQRRNLRAIRESALCSR